MTQRNSTTIQFGTQNPLEVEFPPDVVISTSAGPAATAVNNPAEAVIEALASPKEFPPLAQAIVPGDCVAVVLDEGLPCCAELVAGAVQAILKAGITPEDISIVEPAQSLGPGQSDGGQEAIDSDPRSGLPPEIAEKIHRVVHDPDDADKLFFIGASKQNRPIHVNRSIGEADFVLPIVCRRPSSPVAADAVFNSLFPQFSDRSMVERFQTPGGMQSEVQRKQRAEDIDLAGGLLGVFLTVEIVPGRDGEIAHILAGESKIAAIEARRLSREQTCFEVPHRFDLVVALLEGQDSEQTWNNIARALASAAQAVSVEGAVAICSELATEPSATLALAANADDPANALKDIQRQRSPDAFAAMELAAALARGPAYLMSRLEAEIVESIGMAPIQDVAELTRLCQRYGSCLVLRNAQYTQPVVQGE